MAVQDQVAALDMAGCLAEAIRDEPAAKRLWVSTHRDRVELSILTEPIDSDTELRLYRAGLVLHDRFPDAYFLIDVINPDHFARLDLEMLLPQGAREIPLQRE